MWQMYETTYVANTKLNHSCTRSTNSCMSTPFRFRGYFQLIWSIEERPHTEKAHKIDKERISHRSESYGHACTEIISSHTEQEIVASLTNAGALCLMQVKMQQWMVATDTLWSPNAHFAGLKKTSMGIWWESLSLEAFYHLTTCKMVLLSFRQNYIKLHKLRRKHLRLVFWDMV